MGCECSKGSKVSARYHAIRCPMSDQYIGDRLARRIPRLTVDVVVKVSGFGVSVTGHGATANEAIGEATSRLSSLITFAESERANLSQRGKRSGLTPAEVRNGVREV